MSEIDLDATVPAKVSSILQNVFPGGVVVTSCTPLSGGLTNMNYRVSTDIGDFVVRVFTEEGSLLSIDREREYQNSKAAYQSGAGVEVLGRSLEPMGLVVRYQDGKTLCPSDLHNYEVLAKVVDSCKLLHSGPTFVGRFDMFEVQRQYLKIVQQRGFRLPTSYLSHADQVSLLEKVMKSKEENLVPCNNDLLAENFIDDGERIWIIDYEYSGNNEPSFELGNIWSESNLDADALDELVRLYWGPRASRAKVARARAWGVMSKYGWTLWASIQDAVAEIDFDFWQWGMEKYLRAEEELKDPSFQALLQDLYE
ncbi:Thiamine kinase [Ferrithrix thermotolerans DSM 19514]|uniref:Thiamine kinase n=1 Tax=Ferrithrix thermotolerans DSM 19514 TaxID=1121881 RepID=A0A1M4SB83_9ACTN|nr:choline/ethanolamine kinase family protein [Ferrithrix thermotolerans]SHE29438.1 Thiamine kinase [Ferrithrix thermotolerans DSM 19514]